MIPLTLTAKVIIAIIAYLLYLFLHAQEDTKLRKQGAVLHKHNWRQRALVGIVISFLLFGLSWTALAFCCFLVPVAWIFFDPVMNSMMGEDPWTYIGSGTIDEIYKNIFEEGAMKVILLSKLALFAVTLLIFLISLRNGFAS